MLFRGVKLRRIIWAGHVVSMGQTINASDTKLYLKNLKGWNNLEDLDVDVSYLPANAINYVSVEL